MGDKTVAVDAFEGNNLVLVDEGHRGTGTAAGAWMARRDALVRGVLPLNTRPPSGRRWPRA